MIQKLIDLKLKLVDIQNCNFRFAMIMLQIRISTNLYIGGHPIVFLSGYRAIYEAFVKKIGVFNGRVLPDLEFVNAVEKPGAFTEVSTLDVRTWISVWLFRHPLFR